MRNFSFLAVSLLIALAGAAFAQGVKKPDVQFSTTRFDQFTDVYKDNVKQGKATMITSDSVLHSAHILFDYTLRAAELAHFEKNLTELTNEMTRRMTELAEDEAQKAYFIAPPPYGYDRVAAYYGVAQKLLNPKAKTPEIIKEKVDAEVALILAHNKTEISPIMGVTEDYTQYKPRGHYTRNARFESFFRAMMWYGRAGFPISGEGVTKETARENAWAGMMLAKNLDNLPLYRMPNSPTPLSLWKSIYEPTQFLVGDSDDLTPLEYTALMKKVFGDTLPGSWLEADQKKTDEFIAEAIKLRQPKILGTIQSDKEKAPPVTLRLMGQRFLVDSGMFQRLVHNNVPNRYMPTGLDIMAALGSPTADAMLREKGEFTHPVYGKAYGEELAKLKAEIAALDEAEWKKTAYMIWLNTIRLLVTDATPKVNNLRPAWWNSPEWKAKQLNAGLGSWAELRHDTILYAKQSYTNVTSMPAPNPTQPAYYVEPVPQVYENLLLLVTEMQKVLTEQKVFPQELAANYDKFAALLKALRSISAFDTHSGEEAFSRPAQANYDMITNVGDILKSVENIPPSLRDLTAGPEDAKAALIADVHTDPNSRKVLEVGIGRIMTVTVPALVNGQKVSVTGPIFSYYEFTQPMDKRLTDGEWQKMLDDNKQPGLFVLK